MGITHEPLPLSEGQVDNTVELDLLLRVADIDHVLFPVRQPTPGLPGIRAGRPGWRRAARSDRATASEWGEGGVRSRPRDAEIVLRRRNGSVSREGFLPHVEDLICNPMMKQPLIVDLECVVVRVAGFSVITYTAIGD